MPIGITKSGNGRISFIKRGIGGKANLVPFIEPPGGGGGGGPTYTALSLASAEASYFVLRSDNTLWSWGYNSIGELGLGDWNERTLPTLIPGSWQNISAGAYSLLAVKTDNTLWATGYNQDGLLGLGNEIDINVMTQVSGSNWYQVSTAIGYSSHTLAVKTNGTLWAWGGNRYGQLGIGTTGGDQLTPVQVGSATNWAVVIAGYDRSFAIKTNGTLWSWGSNIDVALGQGDTEENANYLVPTQVGSETNWTKVSSGLGFTFALKSNGTLWVTGENSNGALGVGSATYLSYPSFTQVGSDTDWEDVSCGYLHTTARKSNGTIYTWGYNDDGNLGTGDTTNRSFPTAVGFSTQWTHISSGFYDTLAVNNNTLYYWGWNFANLFGGNSEPQLSPRALSYSSALLY